MCPVDWLKIKPELFVADSAGFLLDITLLSCTIGKELEQKLILLMCGNYIKSLKARQKIRFQKHSCHYIAFYDMCCWLFCG